MTDSPNSLILSLAQWLFLGSFLMLLAVPGISRITQFDPIPLTTEQRFLAEQPVLPNSLATLAAFPRAFETYANDQFGLRGALIKANSYWRVLGLKTSPSDDVALSPEPGWLYAMGDGLAEYQRERPVPQSLLEGWGAMLQTRQNWLAERGIRHLLLVAPNKPTIYPEYLPWQMRPLVEQSPYDQLLEYLDAHTTVDYLDLRSVLFDAKQEHLIYDRTGTHWNFIGTQIASNAVHTHVAQWFPDIEARPLGHFEIEYRDELGGDIAGMLDMQPWFREVFPYPKRTRQAKFRRQEIFSDVPAAQDRRAARQPLLFVNDEQTVNVVFARDSFGNRMNLYLSEPFKSILYYPRQSFYVRRDEPYKTDLFITQLVERMIIKGAEGYEAPWGD